MTAPATHVPAAAPGTIDISQTRPTPFSRLVSVELRKSYDTRSGFWLLVTIGLLVLVTYAVMLIIAVVQPTTTFAWTDFVGAAAFAAAVLLPVLGILLVTSEWSQRTAMTTFTLTPTRPRVILAKLVAGIVWSLVVAVFALIAGAIANAVYSVIADGSTSWTLGWQGVVGFTISMVLAMLSGFALAALILNSPAAIVAYFAYAFVLPTIFAIASETVEFFKTTLPWIDFQAAQTPLFDMSFTGTTFAQLLTSGFIWLVIPLSLGIVRILRAEVK